METRLLIAYALIAFMALAFAGLILYATREGRRRRRSDRVHRRVRKARLTAEAAA
jgi:hypothetical protein